MSRESSASGVEVVFMSTALVADINSPREREPLLASGVVDDPLKRRYGGASQLLPQSPQSPHHLAKLCARRRISGLEADAVRADASDHDDGR